MKKGKLTDVEKACIKGMLSEDVSIASMATQLDRSALIVEKEIERIKSDVMREQLFINKTAAGSKGVSIMTEAASVRVDASKDKSVPSDARSAWIHKIRSDG
jgi:IS30 family transposase